MSPNTPIMRKMLWVSCGQAVRVVEKMIGMAADRDTRDALVARLAVLDRRLAALRDSWNMPGLPVSEGLR